MHNNCVSSPIQLPGLTDLEEIGRGGYGVVYRAWQEQLRRRVAIKVLSARLDATAARRFAQECRAVGSVSGHPNIVEVYEAGTTTDGQSYLVMPLYQDGSLLDRLEREGALPWPEAVSTGIALAGALQTAHEAGLLHRDIKPANVLVDGYGTAHLADFGQARHANDDMTRTGGIVATPGFSAPEILHGDPATARSDVFSLASTVMGLILGRGPFAGDTEQNIAALLLRVVRDPAPDLRPRGVPDPICQVLEQAMDKRPSQRYESAEKFGTALQQAQQATGFAATPMIIAGRSSRPGAASGSSATTVVTAGLPAATAPSAPTVAITASGPVSGPAIRGIGFTGGTDAVAPGTGSRRSNRGRILAALAAVIVVVGGIAAVLSTRGGDHGDGNGADVVSSPPPVTTSAAALTATNVADPQALLLNDPGGLGDWQKVDASDPSAPGEWSIFWDLLGSEPDSQKNVSAAPTCLGLPARPAGSQQNVSDVYTSTGGGYSIPGRYLVSQTMAFVMGSEVLARQMVDPWRSRLAACGRAIGAAGSYDDFPWINHDKSDYPLAGQPLAPRVVVSSPPVGVSLPAVVHSATYRIVYALVDKPQYVEMPPRYFDFIALSAGTSVVYLVLQSNGDPPPEGVRVTAVEDLVRKLVA